MRFLFLTCIFWVFCQAAEPKLPSSAKRILDTISSESLAAKQKAAKELRRISVELGKGGDLDGAEKVQDEAVALEEEIKANKTQSTGINAGAPGLIGTYLRGERRDIIKHDWRTGNDKDFQRRDLVIDFPRNFFGTDVERLKFGIEGNAQNWDRFSVQWDGILRVFTPGTRLSTRSDDASRVWLDLDRNGEYDAGEWGINGWTRANPNLTRCVQGPLSPGLYRIRIQYTDLGGTNSMWLLWDDAAHGAGDVDGLKVVPTEALSAHSSP